MTRLGSRWRVGILTGNGRGLSVVLAVVVIAMSGCASFRLEDSDVRIEPNSTKSLSFLAGDHDICWMFPPRMAGQKARIGDPIKITMLREDGRPVKVVRKSDGYGTGNGTWSWSCYWLVHFDRPETVDVSFELLEGGEEEGKLLIPDEALAK